MRLSTRLLPFALFNSREVSCTTLTIFLLVGENSQEGILQADLPKHINVSTSSVSRNCCLLGEKTQKNTHGMGLVKREKHPNNQKLIVLNLTEAGRTLYDKITNGLK
jgi:DNA-binding MarR family transcriptional regulator